MRLLRCAAFIAALPFALAACAVTGGAGGAQFRTQPGDTVYLIEHYVRADRRQQFEEFVETVLWPAFQRSAARSPARGRAWRQTRLLRPTTANEDGTYTYTFVLDPVVRGESYNVLDLLGEAYPEEEAKQHYARFTDTWARDFTSRPFIQGRASGS
jgi:hypothetical protein